MIKSSKVVALALILCLVFNANTACAEVSPAAAGGRINVVLLGATGNLAKKYLWQGLYNLNQPGVLDDTSLFIYPCATKPHAISEPLLEQVLNSNITGHSAEQVDHFLSTSVASFSQLRHPEQYGELGERITKEQASSGQHEVGRLVYLSVPPAFFGSISSLVNQHLRPALGNSTDNHDRPWLRVVIEKPFGESLESAQALAKNIEEHLGAAEILLVDHYLGKPGLQVVGPFRERNPAWEALLRSGNNNENKNKIESLNVELLETEQVAGRTAFYEQVGVIRDVMQNHMMLMLSVLIAEMPAGPNERMKLIASLSAAGIDDYAGDTDITETQENSAQNKRFFIGQYADYATHVEADLVKLGREVSSGVKAIAPTFAKVRLSVGSGPWSNVPVFLSAGKALHRRRASTTVRFTNKEYLIINVQGRHGAADGASVVASSGLPPVLAPDGWEQVNSHHIQYKTPPLTESSAYQVLLHDALVGKLSSFVMLKEVLESWRVWTPLLNTIEADCKDGTSNTVEMLSYSPGGIDLPEFAQVLRDTDFELPIDTIDNGHTEL